MTSCGRYATSSAGTSNRARRGSGSSVPVRAQERAGFSPAGPRFVLRWGTTARLTVEALTIERSMLHPFVSSRAVRTSWRAGTAFSVTVHAGLIAAAVAASAGTPAARPRHMGPVATERVLYSELPHSGRNAAARRKARGHRSALRLVFPDP